MKKVIVVDGGTVLGEGAVMRRNGDMAMVLMDCGIKLCVNIKRVDLIEKEKILSEQGEKGEQDPGQATGQANGIGCAYAQ